MKIIHCSDLHLGKRPGGTKKFSDTRFEDFFIAFENLIDKISNLEVDIFIISGDIFDKREINPNILEKTENLLKKLKTLKNNLKIIAIEGNHDVIYSQEDSWLEYLKAKKYLDVYSYKKDFEEENFFKVGDVNFYPVGYPGSMVDSALEKLVQKLDEKEKNIVIVHTGISGSDTLPGLVSTKTIDLFKDKVIYMAAGHIHSFTTYPKEKPYFFISGSLEFTNILSEKSDKKGAVYFDTETREYEFIETQHRKRLRTETFEYSIEIEKEFEEFLDNIKLNGEEILIVPIKNKNNEYINIDRLEEIAIQRGILKVYFEIKIGNFNEKINMEGSTLEVEEIEKGLIKDWEILKNKENFAEKFSLLKNLFLNDNNKDFVEVFDKLLEDDENDNKEN
ncbi:metallophosphoesterase family protein [Fusobacterium russii]|uniref:metallophosphoesterase family protein n=1 Tax=Fusobacterium russii TaxID=854 RepID=UPI0003A60AAF|nr:metallophosphoesterase [Fusobacterium russii]